MLILPARNQILTARESTEPGADPANVRMEQETWRAADCWGSASLAVSLRFVLFVFATMANDSVR